MPRTRHALRAALAAAALAAVLPAGAPAAVQVGSSGWSWGNPLPQGNTLRSMSFAAGVPGLGYAVGDFGTLLKTTDGGQNWAGLAVGTFTGLSEVQAVDATTVVTAGGCVARRSTDGGTTFTRIAFTPVESSCREPLAALSFVTPTLGFLVLADGTVLQTADGGTEFTQRTAVPGSRAAGGQAIPAAIAFTSATAGVVAGTDGKIFRTIDAGVSWTVVNDTGRGIRDIAFVSPDIGYAAGDAGLFLRTGDGGATWDSINLGAGLSNLTSVRCADALRCVLATDNGAQLVRTTDGGDTASLVSASTDPILAAAYTSPTQVAAAGANGTTVISNDGGATFTPVGGRLTGSYSRIRAGGTANTAFAPGQNGALARTVDGGKTWTTGNVATSEDVLDVSFPTPEVGYALDSSGGVFRTASAGSAWKSLDPGTSDRAEAIVAPATDVVLTVGPRGLRRSGDGGGTFDGATAGAVARKPLAGVDRGAGSTLVVWGPQDVALSTDAGRTWTAVRKPGRAVRVKGRLVNRRQVAQVDVIDAKNAFLRDRQGRLFRTKDTGAHWTELVGTGTNGVTGMSFASRRTGYLVIPTFGDVSKRSGFLLRTTDGGDTWHPQLVIDTPVPPLGVAAAPNGTDYLLGGTSALLFSTIGGDRGENSELTLATPAARVKTPRTVTLRGNLGDAQGNERVTVSARRPGGVTWQHQTVKTAANGSFTTSWRVTKGTTTFVAQWAGDFRARGTGSDPLTVTVLRSRR